MSYGSIALKIVFRILFFLLIGVCVNVAFGLLFLFSDTSASYALKTGLVVLFLAILPLYYLWKARGQAITTGIRQIYIGGEGLVRKVVDGLVTSVIGSDDEENKVTSKLVSGAFALVRKTENLPLPIRWVLNYFMDKVPFQESFSQVAEEIEVNSENAELISDRVFEKVDDYIKDEVLNTGVIRFWITLALNLIVIGLVYYFFVYSNTVI